MLDEKRVDPELLDRDPLIQENLGAVAKWRDSVVTRHDKPDLFFHKPAILADPGVTAQTAGGAREPGQDRVIGDFPVTVCALWRMGVADPRLDRAETRLMELAGPDYYPCCSSMPNFNGPGPKGGMCRYPNLVVARALSVSPAGRTSEAGQRRATALLDHWTNRTRKKPFLFAMGTDFRKLKFPMGWYNILHLLWSLRSIPGVRRDLRDREMEAILPEKLDSAGRATPESQAP